MPLCHPLSKVEELIRCNVCNFVICRAASGTTTKFLFVFFGRLAQVGTALELNRKANDRYSDHSSKHAV